MGDTAEYLRHAAMHKQGGMTIRSSSGGTRRVTRDGEVVTVSFPAGYDPTSGARSFAVSTEKIPTSCVPYSAIRSLTGAHTGGSIEMVRDGSHPWSRSRVWFSANMAGIEQDFLIL
jgi:hypothetical protein